MAAQAWGVNTPEDFDNLPKTKKIDIIAWYEATWRIRAISAYDEAQEAKHN